MCPVLGHLVLLSGACCSRLHSTRPFIHSYASEIAMVELVTVVTVSTLLLAGAAPALAGHKLDQHVTRADLDTLLQHFASLPSQPQLK